MGGFSTIHLAFSPSLLFLNCQLDDVWYHLYNQVRSKESISSAFFFGDSWQSMFLRRRNNDLKQQPHSPLARTAKLLAIGVVCSNALIGLATDAADFFPFRDNRCFPVNGLHIVCYCFFSCLFYFCLWGNAGKFALLNLSHVISMQNMSFIVFLAAKVPNCQTMASKQFRMYLRKGIVITAVYKRLGYIDACGWRVNVVMMMRMMMMMMMMMMMTMKNTWKSMYFKGKGKDPMAVACHLQYIEAYTWPLIAIYSLPVVTWCFGELLVWTGCHASAFQHQPAAGHCRWIPVVNLYRMVISTIV